MEQPYDEDSVPVEGEEGAGGQISQADARYRRGSPVQHCGVCMHFIKPGDDGNTGACTQVAGTISPYGVSDRYAEAKNPFGPMLGPQERGMVNEMSQSAPDQSRFVQPQQPSLGAQGVAGMRIGRQAY